MSYIELTNTITGAGRRTFVLSAAPVNGTNEVQSVDITGVPTGGTFRLGYGIYRTAEIAFDANAAAIELALEAIPAVGAGNATVSGTSPNFAVTFTGGLGLSDQPTLTLAENNLTGGTDPSVDVTVDTPGVAPSLGGQPAGTMVVDDATGNLYVNGGTELVPSWELVGAQT